VDQLAEPGLAALFEEAEDRLRVERVAPTVHASPLELRGRRAVVLAGPGVVRDGCVDGLRAFAAAANVGVANTWGAKGVFPWDSPHHMGTCGLQAHDFELLGFGHADLIVTTGVDPDESPPDRFALAPVVEVAPSDLLGLASTLTPSRVPIASNQLYTRLAAIAQPGYLDDRFPRHPARAVMDLRNDLPSGGLVAADPGLPGLWIARTLPTSEPGSVVVPARRVPGIAAALALVAARAGRAAIAVTAAPVDDATRAVVELADRIGTPFRLEAWGDDVDFSYTRLLIEAAGPVVAWGGIDLDLGS
jgi:hypothetical protein